MSFDKDENFKLLLNKIKKKLETLYPSLSATAMSCNFIVADRQTFIHIPSDNCMVLDLKIFEWIYFLPIFFLNSYGLVISSVEQGKE